jgi:hypothetical protein
VRAVIPTPATTGNVTVTFGVLSYAGTLRITVLSDPSRVPDVAVLTAALRRDWAARPADRRGLGLAGPLPPSKLSTPVRRTPISSRYAWPQPTVRSLAQEYRTAATCAGT